MKHGRGLVGFILFWLVVTSVACPSTVKAPTLSKSMAEFNDALRWKRNQKAARFVVPMHRSNFVREREESGEERRIIEYRILEVTQIDANTAAATVRWEFTPVASPVVVKERTVQFWTRVGEQWFLLRIEDEKEDEEPAKKVAPEAGDRQDNPQRR